MAACNDYYYATRDPLGRNGDFTTAPEISQLFGELVGAVLADCWIRAGRPEGTRYVELGPGRGSLAADALRAIRAAGLDPPVELVETSPVLREVQAATVAGARWHDALDSVAQGPLLAVANEFLDALPVRQYVRGIERRVEAIGDGLAFDRDGEVVETSPARDAAVAGLARRLAKDGGVAIIIDYGHAQAAPGDTLQAVRGHAYAPVLHRPGEQDLTAHVDFAAVRAAALNEGCSVTPLVEQGAWLERLGIARRAERLAAANPDHSADIAAAVERLTGERHMGRLFKAVAIHSPDWPAPAGFA